PLTLDDARVDTTYDLQFGAEGATKQTVWRVAGNSRLPPGLTLDADGRLHGRPTTAQLAPYVFTIEVFDAAALSARPDEPALFTQAYSIRVSGPVRRITVATRSNAGGQVADAADTDTDPCTKNPETDDDTAPIDIESNSDTLTIAVRNRLAQETAMEKGANAVFDLASRKQPIANPGRLIADTIGKCDYAWEHDDYVIIHLVKWPETDPPARAGNPTKYEVKKEKWFLYRNKAATGGAPEGEAQTVQEGTRIYGHRRVAVLLVHLTARESWDIKYTVDVKKKIPANIQNAIDLAGIIMSNPAAGEDKRQALPSYWGGRMLLLKDIPADIAVKSDIVFLPSAGIMALAGEARPGAAVEKDQQTQQQKAYEKVYDNEGRYHWDVSVGLPVKGFKEVKYDAENGQVTAREVNRQNAYGFLNLFFNPRGVDTKGEEFIKTPHLVLGVPISGKPLDSPMVGLGMGVYKTNFKFNLFAGVVFNRVREPRTLAAGETATPAQLEGDLQTRRVTKFIFGFNIPVKQFKEALTPKK
ncbi:MAG TPA: Ig domain-containing protein, partial [Pyrinomonadaceae bacterium]